MTWEITQYLPLVQKILQQGSKRDSRAGPVYSIFGETIDIDLSTGYFPLLHGREMFYKPVFGELAAMIRGPKCIGDFKKFGCNYWDEFADNDGMLNVDYGNAWLDFNGVNQLQVLIDTIKSNPTDRRLLISGWRPDKLDDLSLPCCHLLYQWYVRDNTYLDMIWYQRSVDTMVGLPSDIILCALWNILLAIDTKYIPGKIKLVLGDTHIYTNHLPSTMEYIRQTTSLGDYSFAKWKTTSYHTRLQGFTPDMIHIENYKPKPPIKFILNV